MWRREPTGAWLVVLLGALTTAGALSMDMYLPALPQLATNFSVSESRSQLTITAFLLGLGLGQMLLGPLSDRWGRRRPAVAALGGYVAASMVCAVAPSIDTLTAARVVQGTAAGAVIVIARAVVRDRYEGRRAAAYFSQLTLVFGVVPVLAPSLGGAVLRYTDWRGVFLVLAGIGLLLLVAAAVGLTESLPPARRTAGALRQTGSAFGTILRDRAFLGYLIALASTGASIFCYISGSPFVLQRVYGASPQTYGLLFGLNAAGFVVAGQLNARLVHRVHPRRILGAALVAMAIAAVALVIAAQTHSLVGVEIPLLGFMTAFGFVLPNTMALALDAHPDSAGSAAALLGMGQSAAGAVAAPLVGLVPAAGAMPMAAGMAGMAAVSLAAFAVASRFAHR